MSSLVPTPRADKNGRVVTRHMRPESSSAAAPSGFPPAALAAPTDQTPDAVLTALLDAARRPGHSRTEDLGTLRLLIEDDPKLLPLATKLTAEGGESARMAAGVALESAVEGIDLALREIDEFGPDGLGVDWRELGSQFIGISGRRRLARAWATGNVFDEVGDGARGDLMWPEELHAIQQLDIDLGCPAGAREEDADEPDMGYWRGIGALRAILNLRGIGRGRLSLREQDKRSMDYFARWAGAHEDVPSVVRVAVERKTFFGKTIQAVIDAQRDVAAPVRDGVL